MMRMDQGLPERRAPIYFGIARPELLEEEIFLDEDLLASERSRKKKPLFGFLAAEAKSLPASQVDPTTLSRANKFGGR
jgi:hypothetical protein